jgi:hypothetical protein
MSEHEKVRRNKTGETDNDVHGAVAGQCVMCIKARDVGQGRIMLHVIATIF